MKKSILLALLIASSLIVKGQENIEPEEKKWSAGLNLFSFGINFYDRPVFRIWNGVTIKREYKSFEIRMGAEYFFQTHYESDWYFAADIPSYEGKENEFILKFGIEKSLIRVKFASLYGALDLFGSRQYSDLDINGGWHYNNENHKRTMYSIGIVPVLGLKFQLKNNFSLNAEIRAVIPNKYSKTHITYYRTGKTEVKNEKQFGYYYDKGFTSLSLNYSF